MLNRNSIISLPSIANIRAVGVRAYWDPNLQNQTTRIDWGTVYLGSSNNASLYLQSTSNVQTTLVLTTTNWTLINADINNTIASGLSNSTPHMNLTWDSNNHTLNPNHPSNPNTDDRQLSQLHHIPWQQKHKTICHRHNHTSK